MLVFDGKMEMSENRSNVVEYDFTHDYHEAIQQPEASQAPHDAQGDAAAHPAAHQHPAAAPGGVHGNGPAAHAIPSYNALVQQRKKKSRRSIVLIGVVACVCIAALVAVFVAISTAPVRVTVDGRELTVGGDRTLEEAFVASGASVKPGNLLAVDGELLENGGGNKFSATVNGEETSDGNRKLSEGDAITFANGMDAEEPSTVEETAAPYGATDEGTGAVHVIEGTGVDGVKSVKTGSVSGRTVEFLVEEPTNVLCRHFNIDTGGEKVVALTFDDGPLTTYTTQILDILAANNAKGTFFTVGDRITGDNIGVVKRAASEGHQVSTHSFDHADGAGQGVNLGYMSDEEIVAEIEKGYEAISAATGAEANRTIRTPGGNFGENVIVNLQPLINAEIGWNIDTHDWKRPGAAAIESQILSVKPGYIVLMHDGGGDRSQTVEALRSALPKLAAQGYRFVTVDELLQYAS